MSKAKKPGRKMLANGRSKGTDAGQRWVILYHDMLKCPAYHELPGDAVKVLLAMWVHFNGMNNGDIGFAVRDAAAVGIGRDVTAEALRWLEALGFIECTEPAAMLGRRSRRWRLTEEPVGEAKATRDCRKLTEAQAAAIAAGLRTKRRKRPPPNVGQKNRARPTPPDEYVRPLRTQGAPAPARTGVVSDPSGRKGLKLVVGSSDPSGQS
jgi:hypothetical protein